MAVPPKPSGSPPAGWEWVLNDTEDPPIWALSRVDPRDMPPTPIPGASRPMTTEESAWYTAKHDWEGYSVGGKYISGTGGGKPFLTPPPSTLPDAEYWRGQQAASTPKPLQPPGSTLNTRSGDLTLASGEVIRGWAQAQAPTWRGSVGSGAAATPAATTWTPQDTTPAPPKVEPPYTGNVPIPTVAPRSLWRRSAVGAGALPTTRKMNWKPPRR